MTDLDFDLTTLAAAPRRLRVEAEAVLAAQLFGHPRERLRDVDDGVAAVDAAARSLREFVSDVLTLTTSPSTTSACASVALAAGASTPLCPVAEGLAASALLSVGTLRLRPDCARNVPAPWASIARLSMTNDNLLILWVYDVRVPRRGRKESVNGS